MTKMLDYLARIHAYVSMDGLILILPLMYYESHDQIIERLVRMVLRIALSAQLELINGHPVLLLFEIIVVLCKDISKMTVLETEILVTVAVFRESTQAPIAALTVQQMPQLRVQGLDNANQSTTMTTPATP